MLEVTPTIIIDDSELHEEFVRASGPGGQNVNKVSTAVQLRFNVANSSALPDGVRRRLIALAGNRINSEGELVLVARDSRSQLQNREEARAQLVDLIRQATIKPKIRRKTKPTFAAQQKRLAGKRVRSDVKRLRQAKPRDE